MKKSECICCNCSHWVNCGWKNGKPYGFCIMKDLFTYTCKSTNDCCIDFDKGKPISSDEWEDENDPKMWMCR